MIFRVRAICAAPLFALASLAACAGETEAPADAPEGASSDAETEATASQMVIGAESGWLTIGTDGAVQTTFLDTGARYRDFRNSELLAEGTWEVREDGALCFEPDAGRGDCWEIGAADENGAAVATNSDGKVIEIKRVTYLPPGHR